MKLFPPVRQKFICTPIILIKVVYIIEISLVKADFKTFMGIFGLMFIVYFITIAVLWFYGSKKAAGMERALIEEKIKADYAEES